MKSPFLIVQDFLSPQLCENLINTHVVRTPDIDVQGDPKKSEHHVKDFEFDIIERFRELIPDLEARYNCNYRGLEKPVVQHFPENAKAPAEQPGCENSKFIRKKWVMTKDVDLVGFVWLKDYNENIPLDPRFEVLGGKMEFPVYNFSLTPQRGTLVMFPAGPHFITVISPILLGELYQIKLNVCVSAKNAGRWFYQPSEFPGKWSDWLSEFM